jgi:glycogen operon protein
MEGSVRGTDWAALRVRPGKPVPLGPSVLESGVQFALFSRHATKVWLALFERIEDTQPAREIELAPAQFRFGDVWSVVVEGLKPGALYAYRVDGPNAPTKGHRFDPSRYLLDPYARCTSGDVQHGTGKCIVVEAVAEGPVKRPRIPIGETILYETHVRGLTQHPSSGAEHRGSYRGVVEKIPYLKELGITAVELMPVHQVGRIDLERVNPLTKEPLRNYWNYDPICFFAPMAHFASQGGLGEQVAEFREMVNALHEAGIEVILDMVFNHTGEVDQRYPATSFRGIDNRTYYRVDDRGGYIDLTGCANTVDCSNTVVQDLIVDCLRYWVVEMGVDGFRFDLATILARGRDGQVRTDAPLVERIACDPVLREAKLIAEPWDAAGGYLVGNFNGSRWGEWNDRFRDDARVFWLGNNGAKEAFSRRFVGSPDLYGNRSPHNSVNMITAHDGFTLRDAVSYIHKHNEANGEGNNDGSNNNLTWNFGVEGETDDPLVNTLRLRMQKNFLASLFLSLGVPMLLGGDEFGRTQKGNNNPYCQDNEISWYDWSLLEKNSELFRFCKEVIRLRKENPVFGRGEFLETAGKEPDLRWLNHLGKTQEWRHDDASIAACISGHANGGTVLYIAYNTSLDPIEYVLPQKHWRIRLNTARPSPDDVVPPERAMEILGGNLHVAPKSMVVLTAEG